MSVEENKAIVRRFFDEIMNKGNAALIDELLAPNFTNHFGAMPPADREMVKRYLPMYPAAFPDVHTTVEDMMAEGDMVAVRFTLHGTHTGGAFMGIPPSGKSVTMGGMAVFHLAGGQIVAEYVNEHTMGRMQQLAPAAPPAA